MNDDRMQLPPTAAATRIALDALSITLGVALTTGARVDWWVARKRHEWRTRTPLVEKVRAWMVASWDRLDDAVCEANNSINGDDDE